MDALATIAIMFMLLLKHLIADFFLQSKYQYSNKGTYLHPGGLLHAAIHVVLGIIVLRTVPFISINVILIACLIDGFIHYHIDWAKVKIIKHFGWGPTTHEEFWYVTGVDQFLHMVTYLFMLIIFHANQLP